MPWYSWRLAKRNVHLDIFSTQSFCQTSGLFLQGNSQINGYSAVGMPCSSLHMSSYEATGCIYKAGEILRCPNIYNINILHNQVGHRAGNVGAVPLQGEGFRDGCSTDAGFARKSPWAISSYRTQGMWQLLVPRAGWGELRGCCGRQEKVTSKPRKSTGFCFGNRGGHCSLLTFSPGSQWD